MYRFWRVSRLEVWMFLGSISMVYQNVLFSSSLNDEGMALLRFKERVVNDPFGAILNWNENIGEADPCSWSGVDCAEGNVVSLNLKDLCLEGTLAPEIGHLSRIKSIVLRNNSFYGIIPKDIGELKELEMLDLGYNNFSGPLPSKLGHNILILLLDNNELFFHTSSELKETIVVSEVQMDKNHLENTVKESSYDGKLEASSTSMENGKASPYMTIRHIWQPEDPVHWRELVENTSHVSHRNSPPPSPTASGSSSSKDPPPSSNHSSHSPQTARKPSPVAPPPSASAPAVSLAEKHKSSKNLVVIVPAVIGGLAVLSFIICGLLWKSKKIVMVGPWTTGLSGQLQKAFIAGVRKLNRSELEIACEDFSNVICTSSVGTIYKGTLSSGTEIAVMSYAVSSSKDWSTNLETRFRKKIDTFSQVNHKNFVNLLGFCEEEEPFARMMVFEYAPNGTLFEHLHIKEAEHFDWGMRLRIAMGMAYCLEHMHQLNPPIAHGNINSSSVNLSEDYAAKISDFGFSDETIAGFSTTTINNSNTSATLEDDVYAFGIVLLEMMTGQIPHFVCNGSLEDGSSQHLLGQKPVEEIMDPMLRYFDPQQAEMIGELIRCCVHPAPQHRPTMREIAARLRDITGMSSAEVAPKLNPLWWAHLELQSVNGG
ncbi:hypothetical protein Ancab_005988 [Ancistrocladus abbreviatus]